MDEQILFNALVVASFVMAVGSFITLLFVSAPYGRHVREGWGPLINNRLGWVIMEAPAAIIFVACFRQGDYTDTLVALILFGLWEAHYVHRTILYPFLLRGRDKQMTLLIAIFGGLFNVLNGYLNGRHVFTHSGGYPDSWLTDRRFVIGMMMFVTGFLINHHADHVLRSLRERGESDYKIPYGGMYRWVSSPNYLGEIMEWVGWAVATWSLPGLVFAVWTIANLAPRALDHHKWYQENFPDYPDDRKVLVPGLW